jgi:hypothetical protein
MRIPRIVKRFVFNPLSYKHPLFSKDKIELTSTKIYEFACQIKPTMHALEGR